MNTTTIDPSYVGSRWRILFGSVGRWLTLIRLPNLLIVAFGVAVGGVLGANGLPIAVSSASLLAMAAAVSVAAGANVLNDVIDVEVDRVNRPSRPIAATAVGRKSALFVSIVLIGAGVAAAALLSTDHLILAGSVAVLIVSYDLFLSRSLLLGNIAVALCVAATIIFGAMTTGSEPAAMAGAAFAFLTTLAREVVKDIQDVAGDKLEGGRTLPIVLGKRFALGFALATLALTILLVPLPFLLLGFSGLYLLAGFGASAFLAAAAWSILRNRPDINAASLRLKLAMVFGLVALLLANSPE